MKINNNRLGHEVGADAGVEVEDNKEHAKKTKLKKQQQKATDFSFSIECGT